MNAAAASSNRRRMQRQKSILRARAACKRKAETRAALASKTFDSLANSSGRLPDDRVETFLQTALLLHKDQLHPDAARLVRETALANRRNSINNNINTAEPSFSKPAMMDAIQKYGLYLSKRDEIQSIFDQFDIDQDGYLSREEIQKALRERERTARRCVHGIVTELIVTEEDVDFILKATDVEGDGRIDRVEILAALAAWEELAESRLEEMEKECVCACVLL